MTDLAAGSIAVRPARRDIGIKRRYAAEARFKAYGLIAIVFGLAFLVVMLTSIVAKGYTAFGQKAITLPVRKHVRDANAKVGTSETVLAVPAQPAGKDEQA